MALFKILRGSSTGLKDLPINDGWCYFTPDTGLFYIDYNGTRVPLNAKDAQTLSGASLVQTLNSEGLDQEILSAAAIDEIKNNLELLIAAKQEHIAGNEGQVVVIGANGRPTVIDTSLFTAGGVINQNTSETIKIWRGTKAEYNALGTKSDDTMYVITDANSEPKPTGKSYLTFSSPNSFTLKVNDTTKHWDGTLEYSADTSTWSTWDGTTELSSAKSGSENVLYLRGKGNTVITGDKDKGWSLTGTNISCSGNIQTLLNYETAESDVNSTLAERCFHSLFKNCASLITSPELPATTLATSCYNSMFYGCTGLTTAPELPATALAASCYNSMFYGCTSLTTAPELPATTLAGAVYADMFYGCTSLTTAPELPATKLMKSCYKGMFINCTRLIAAPELPATEIAENCYHRMFDGCTGIITAPALPATTLYRECYRQMFYGCTSMTTAPRLPATEAAEGCYYAMFYNCSNLVEIPELQSVTMPKDCYLVMFKGCSSIKLSTTKTVEYTQEYRIPTSGDGSISDFTYLGSMFDDTGGTFTGTPTINTTYYLSSDNMVVHDTEVATLREYVRSIAAPASHVNDTTIHVTAEEKALWNAKSDSFTETDPTVPAWAKEASKPSYTASEVGAVPTSRTVNGKALSSDITLNASDVGAITMNEVNAAIQTAIGDAIGGSY